MNKIMIQKYTSHGFSLVELIIVISVIAILATIGIMSWSGAQNQAKQNAAIATLAKVKLQLGEYFTDTNTYPTNKTAICDKPTYAVISSIDLYKEFCENTNQSSYLYTASPASCNNTTTKCTSYVLTAKKELWKGSTDATLEP